MRILLIFALIGISSLIIPLSAFSQDSLKCPKGTYYGLDNSGNEACRDILTNQIVNPTTGIMTDSQTGEIILQEDQMTYLVIGAIIIIIIIAGIAKASSGKSEPESIPRRGWTELEKEQVRIRQDGKCAKCQRPPPRWEYHHKDEDRSNNGLENCQGLCPNCHSIETNE